MENLKINKDAQLCNPANPTIGNFREWLKRNFHDNEGISMVQAFDNLKETVRFRYGCSLNGEKEVHSNGNIEADSGSALNITEFGFNYVEWCHDPLSRYAYRFEFSGEMYYAAVMVG